MKELDSIIERANKRADEIFVCTPNEDYKMAFVRHYALGAKEQKKIDIEKAINWLLENCFVDMGSHDTNIHFNSGYIHEFKKAMEEQDMKKDKTTRELYMNKCKHWEGDICCKKSGWYDGIHLLVPCDGDCRRMKNYDKKIKAMEE